jgi:hypothetical protein
MIPRLKTFFYLTISYFGWALVLSLVLIAGEFGPVLYQALSDFDGGHTHGFEGTSHYIGNFFDTLNNAPLAATIITALVWGLVGLILYTIFYLIANILIDARNELYVAAGNSVDGVSSTEVFVQAGGKLAAALGYLLFIGLTLLYFIKMWMNMIYIYIYGGFKPVDLPYLLLGFLGLAFNLYLAFVLAKLIWKSNETAVVYS